MKARSESWGWCESGGEEAVNGFGRCQVKISSRDRVLTLQGAQHSSAAVSGKEISKRGGTALIRPLAYVVRGFFCEIAVKHRMKEQDGYETSVEGI